MRTVFYVAGNYTRTNVRREEIRNHLIPVELKNIELTHCHLFDEKSGIWIFVKREQTYFENKMFQQKAKKENPKKRNTRGNNYVFLTEWFVYLCRCAKMVTALYIPGRLNMLNTLLFVCVPHNNNPNLRFSKIITHS